MSWITDTVIKHQYITDIEYCNALRNHNYIFTEYKNNLRYYTCKNCNIICYLSYASLHRGSKGRRVDLFFFKSANINDALGTLCEERIMNKILT